MTSQLFGGVEVGRPTVQETNRGRTFFLVTLAADGPREVAGGWGSQGLILNNFKVLLSFFFW